MSNQEQTVEECFDSAKSDVFCGNMFVMDGTSNCFCRAIGKQRTCTKEPDPNWNVYAMNPGLALLYNFIQKMVECK